MVKTFEQMRGEFHENKEKKNIKRVLVISFIALFLSVLAYSSIQSPDIAFEIIVNNTNLAPSFAGEDPGTGERNDSVTYYANNSAIQLFVWAHATTSGDNSEIHLYINGTKVADTSGRPLGIAESSNKTITAIIPRYASYMVEFNNYHHYEWREYPILSGQNGTLSINLTNVTNIISGGGNGSHANLSNLDFYNSSHTGFAASTASKTITVGASGKNYTTIYDAYASIEPVIEGDVTILVDAGTYPAQINMGGKTSRNGFVINIVANNTTTLVSTTGTGGTAGSLTTQSTVVKTGAGWTVDAYQGKWIVFTSGNNTGLERLIENNTADTLRLVGNFLSSAPANGEVFNIIENNVNVIGDIHMYPSGVKHIFRNINLKEFSGTQVSVEYYNSQLEPGSYLNNQFLVSNIIFDRTFIKTQTSGNLYGYYMISIYSEMRNGTYAYGNFSSSSSIGWSTLVYSGHVLVRDGSLIKNYWAGLWSRLGGSALIWRGDLGNAAAIQFHNNSVALKADQAGFIQVDDAVFAGSTAADKSPSGKTDPGWIS